MPIFFGRRWFGRRETPMRQEAHPTSTATATASISRSLAEIDARASGVPGSYFGVKPHRD
jgi:hypothetical protein